MTQARESETALSMPLIGVSGRRWPVRRLAAWTPPAVHGELFDLHFVGYFRATVMAGGLPVGLSRDAPVEPLLRRLDALVLSGGADVDPRNYKEPPSSGCGAVEPERDAWELALLEGAIERSLPVLAICRGLQLLNVMYGGTLLQDVAADVGDRHPRFERPPEELAHEVTLNPGSIAASIYGRQIKVNSLHHQVVEAVGESLSVTGRSPDKTVEALELPGASVLAVQWHPEMVAAQPDPAFTWIVKAAQR
ncbi:MAG: gamma-glutamyl-gamma-aminobutyrate hydrolase family protein [Acidimicrobiales bacterium]